MNSTDGVNNARQLPTGHTADSLRQEEAKKLPKSAEDYVMIENRLAAHREKPQPSAQLNSIFDELRGRLPR